MKAKIFTTLAILSSVLIGYAGVIEKPTAAQMEIFNSSLKPFLLAYYNDDYDMAWKLGKVAYSNEPYGFRSKEEFLSVIEWSENDYFGEEMVFSKKLFSLNLSRVDRLPHGVYFHVLAIYRHTMRDTETNMEISCERMEHTLFRVDMEYKDFDLFASLLDEAYQCFEGRAT
ncbi:MAG: hypothetical protein V3S46_01915 [Nitrospinota bacterium]